MVEAFHGHEALAGSVNHLLVVGFYLVNLGFVCFFLKGRMRVQSGTQALEALSTKVGIVMLVLGGMYFSNLLLFNRWRTRAALKTAPPPVLPRGQLPNGRLQCPEAV